MARVTHMAVRVEAMAMVEIASGPNSLQKRSMRRIRAFTTSCRSVLIPIGVSPSRNRAYLAVLIHCRR